MINIEEYIFPAQEKQHIPIRGFIPIIIPLHRLPPDILYMRQVNLQNIWRFN